MGLRSFPDEYFNGAYSAFIRQSVLLLFEACGVQTRFHVSSFSLSPQLHGSCRGSYGLSSCRIWRFLSTRFLLLVLGNSPTEMQKLGILTLSCLILFTYPVSSLSIMIYCYKQVFRFICQHKVNTAYLTTHEIHLTKALFVIVFVFFASCVPSFLAIILVRVILHSSCMPREMVLLLPYLMHVSSAINPWIYGDLSPLVRSKIKKVFFKRRVQLQDGEVTVLCTYQRKSKSPEENMIAPESNFVISQNSD